MTTDKKHPWQIALSNLITDPTELLELLELNPALLPAAKLAAQQFPLKVPRNFISRIEKGNPHDPLLLQILPLGEELQLIPGYTQDPLQENAVNPVPGLLHKYYGRVLVTLTSACAVHCRYCFRRHFPYAENNPGTSGWEKIFAYIAADETISEIILSGGDPLSVSDGLLKKFTDQLCTIKHVKRLRIHSRSLIIMPERITDEFIHWAKQLPLHLVIIVHTNHANEINQDVTDALNKLRDAGIMILNQSVLLKNVNDKAETLIALSEKLFSNGIVPYYLHTLDKVQGATHFDMPISKARSLHEEMQKRLPGYLVPRLVFEASGEMHKISIM